MAKKSTEIKIRFKDPTCKEIALQVGRKWETSVNLPSVRFSDNEIFAHIFNLGIKELNKLINPGEPKKAVIFPIARRKLIRG